MGEFRKERFRAGGRCVQEVVTSPGCEAAARRSRFSPKGPKPESLRCSCMAINLTLEDEAEVKVWAASAPSAGRALVNGTPKGGFPPCGFDP